MRRRRDFIRRTALAAAVAAGLIVGLPATAGAGAVARLTRNIAPATQTAVRHVVEKEPRDEMLDYIVRRAREITGLDRRR